jgi:hypothetical protein
LNGINDNPLRALSGKNGRTTPMEFKISAARRKELARIEAESDCDIGAGFDLGENVDKFYANYLHPTPISEAKLMALLQSELGDRLSPDQIISLANDVQIRAQRQLEEQKIA